MNMWVILLPTIVGFVLATLLLIEEPIRAWIKAYREERRWLATGEMTTEEAEDYAFDCEEDRWIESQLEYDEFEGMSEEEFASRYYN